MTGDGQGRIQVHGGGRGVGGRREGRERRGREQVTSECREWSN